MRDSLGLVLVREGLLTPSQLVHAQRTRDGRPLEQWIIGLGWATEDAMARAMAKSNGPTRRTRPALVPWRAGRPLRSPLH